MLKFTKTLLLILNKSLIVKLSYILFFATVLLTNSILYVSYSLKIIFLTNATNTNTIIFFQLSTNLIKDLSLIALIILRKVKKIYYYYMRFIS